MTAFVDPTTYEKQLEGTRDERMGWWREARFGMFVHIGTYSVLGRHEWVKANEGIPDEEYDKLADQFAPERGSARKWAKLAKAAGMKYMVLTTKHHEGFCLWDTALTDYNAVKRGPGYDIVAEYVEACRAEGLRVGFYYSLMDWHHPDGARCVYDRDARRRFLDYTQGCLRELMSNYGKVDVLWYDVPCPFASAEGWESLQMNQMVRELQPEIIINDRSVLPEDFGTPEEQVKPEKGRDWEACMTFNRESWGYVPSDQVAQDSYTTRGIVKMLNKVCGRGGNLLLNIGPKPDGSIPEEVIEPLQNTGKWLAKNTEAVYGKLKNAVCGNCSQSGDTLYMWRHMWYPEFGIAGFHTKVKSVVMLPERTPVEFEQDGMRLKFTNLPEQCPDELAGIVLFEMAFEEAPRYTWVATTLAWFKGHVLEPDF